MAFDKVSCSQLFPSQRFQYNIIAARNNFLELERFPYICRQIFVKLLTSKERVLQQREREKNCFTGKVEHRIIKPEVSSEISRVKQFVMGVS